MFMAHCINDPLSDPGLYVKLKHRQEAFLFDLGDLRFLSPRQILRLSHIFVSHTHMDHFIGFDHFLRISLGRDGHISLFGPTGFIENVEGKLAAYTWNLVHNYRNDFTIRAVEVSEGSMVCRQYQCRSSFRPEELQPDGSFDGLLLDRDDLTVRAAILDHRVPSLAFALKEKQHINIMKNGLDYLGLLPGPWLRTLKDSIMRECPGDKSIAAPARGRSGQGFSKTFALTELVDRVVKITPGQKISYVTDAIFNERNVASMVDLVRGSDMLFIEAPFLDEDREKAEETYHLTARQAGRIAGSAGVKAMRIFHLSPKYKGRENLLFQEAAQAFRDSVIRADQDGPS